MPGLKYGCIEAIIKGVATSVDTPPSVVRTVNVLHFYLNTAGTTVPNIANWLPAWVDQITVPWRIVFPEAWTCTEISARYMNDTSVPAQLAGDPSVLNGTYLGDWQPTETTVYVYLKGVERGRQGRGAKILSPVPEGLTVQQRLSDVPLIGGEALYGALVSALLTPVSDITNGPLLPFIFNATSFLPPTVPGTAQIRGVDLESWRVRKTLGRLSRRQAASVY